MVLSFGHKEGDALRCMYHGMKFAPGGECSRRARLLCRVSWEDL
ncbi:hypothetical protein [Paraburkholderia sp. J63]